MYSEKRIIRLAMIVLFLSLMIVYVLLYNIKWNKLKKVQNTESNTQPTISEVTVIEWWGQTTLNPVEVVEEVEKTPNTMFNMNIEESTWTKLEDTTTGTNNFGNEFEDVSYVEEDINYEESQEEIVEDSVEEKIKVLSGTEMYYGPLESLEKLGIAYQYSLKDDKDIYYIYLGKQDTVVYDFNDIARKLGWSTYIINTEKGIIENKLFGDKAVYINLPEYKDRTVLLLTYIDDHIRLLQIGYPIYHQSKWYLQDLFNDY